MWKLPISILLFIIERVLQFLCEVFMYLYSNNPKVEEEKKQHK